LLESQNMSQGQATNFAWQNMDSNGVNDMFSMSFTSCNGADVNFSINWLCHLICWVENNGNHHTLGSWYFQHALY
jgi:hypothetical protein